MMVFIGNICRSPIAEVYLKHLQSELNVYSSGLGALVGKPADPKPIELMQAINVDLTKHEGQQINSVLVPNADLILTMEHSHVDAIQSKYPESRDKVHLISKWTNNQSIPDPYKKDQEAFLLASTMIQSGIDAWQRKLWQ